jgi:hypothetical protein
VINGEKVKDIKYRVIYESTYDGWQQMDQDVNSLEEAKELKVKVESHYHKVFLLSISIIEKTEVLE